MRRIHTVAVTAPCLLQEKIMTYLIIKPRTHTVAVTAVRVSHINFIFYLMRETTLGRNHTVAVTATRL